MEQEML